MAFSADELRVLRRALAEALRPTPASYPRRPGDRHPADRHPADRHPADRHPGGRDAGGCHPGDIKEYFRLAEAVDEAAREGGRLRMFHSAELARYRDALPGAATGYLERLRSALDTHYVPVPADLAALRLLRRGSRAGAEGLLHRCEHLAELDVRARLARRTPPVPHGPEPRLRLLAFPGGGSAADDAGKPGKPGEKQGDEPSRKVPTPAEIWPRRRPPTAPSPEPSRKPEAPEESEAPEERSA